MEEHQGADHRGLPAASPVLRQAVMQRMRTAATMFAAALALMFAAYYLATALFAIANFGWRAPMFDQFRLYGFYLGLPFPDNVLQLENGHRPVFPALLRLFEVWCCSANQQVQLAVGAGLATVAASLPALAALRERTVGVPQRAAASLACVLGIFWLANARMLMHGNESVHAYLVVVAVMASAMCTVQSVRSGSLGWSAAATLANIVAMFSFGPGVAAFASSWLLLLALRAPRRLFIASVVGFGLALGAYLFLLPGEAGVRGQLAFRPMDAIGFALQWLGSPPIHAWLEAGHGVGRDWVAQTVAADGTVGQLLAYSAGAMSDVGGSVSTARARWSLVFGCVGLLAWMGLALRLALRRRGGMAEWMAMATGSFVIAAALLVAVARSDYFDQHPTQVFADRYLVWSSLFWAMLVVQLALAARECRWAWLQWVPVVVVVCLAVALLPTHRAWAGWSAAVSQQSELVVVGAWTGVRERIFPDGPDASAEAVDRTLQLMRARALGPYADPPAVLPGDALAWKGPLACSAARAGERWTQGSDGRTIVRFDGHCPTLSRQPGAWLALVDEEGQVRGLARRTRNGEGLLTLRPLHSNGYSGLLLDPRPDGRYTVVHLRENGPAQAIARLSF